jgi:hypothetical protein
LVLTTGFVWAQVGGGITTSAGTISGGPQGLKGIPYSADVITETNRVLADGNRIHQETHGKQFRDSEGRTRTETEFPIMAASDAPIQSISIVDPLQGVLIHLDSRTKTATIRHFNLRSTQPNPATTLPGNATITSQPALPARVESPERVRPEDLGTMEIEGFTVKGTRFTNTIPAGRIGNEQPITNVRETWVSPVLKLALLTKNDDPQSGQRIMKLVNIRASEPDPSLFQVPADYSVKDDGAQR